MHDRLNIAMLRPIFDNIHMVHMDCMVWRMRCLSHRLLEFGWEDSVRHLSVPEALILAALLPAHMHDAVVEAAWWDADDAQRALIRARLPNLVPEPAHV